MKKFVFPALAVCLIALVFPAASWAQSARHLSMAHTGIGAFNPMGYAPIIENAAAAAGSPKYNVLWENEFGMLYSKADVFGDAGDANLDELVMGGLGAVTFLIPLTGMEKPEMGGRVSLFGHLGYLTDVEYFELDYNDVDAKDKVLHQAGGPSLRLGVAYGLSDMLSLGAAVNYKHLNRASEFEEDNNDDNYKMKMAPELEGFKIEDYELGLLFRPVNEFQIGGRVNFGDHAYVEDDSVSVTVDGDDAGEATYGAVYTVRAGYGLGFAYFGADEWSLALDLQRTNHDEFKIAQYPEATEISLGFEKGFSQKYKVRAGIGKADEDEATYDGAEYGASHAVRFDVGGGFLFANVVVLDLGLGVISGDTEPQGDTGIARTAGFEGGLTLGGHF